MTRYKAMICIRRGILDNAGQTVTNALQTLGWPEVKNVRIDKIIEFNLKNITNFIASTKNTNNNQE